MTKYQVRKLRLKITTVDKKILKTTKFLMIFDDVKCPFLAYPLSFLSLIVYLKKS